MPQLNCLNQRMFKDSEDSTFKLQWDYELDFSVDDAIRRDDLIALRPRMSHL
jgi:hypothetical protein